MVDHRVKGCVARIGRTAEFSARLARFGDLLFEFLDQARFTNTWLSTQQHDLSLSDLGLLPTLLKEFEFFRAANQGSQSRCKSNFKPALRAFFSNDLVDRDGSRLAFERMRPQRVALKKAFHESIGCRTHHGGICFGNRLEARSNIRSLTEREVFVPLAGTHVAHHDLSGVNTDPQPNPRRAFSILTERRQAPCLPDLAVHTTQLRKNAQACFHRTYSSIFVGNRIAKIDQKPIAKILGDIAVETLNNSSAGILIGLNNVSPLLGVKLAGECH